MTHSVLLYSSDIADTPVQIVNISNVKRLQKHSKKCPTNKNLYFYEFGFFPLYVYKSLKKHIGKKFYSCIGILLVLFCRKKSNLKHKE